MLLAVPNYIFATDLLRTRYIEYLASKYKVVVLTPFLSESDAISRRYYQSPDVVYVQRQLENPRFWNLFKFLRICWVSEFDYLDSVKYFYLRPNYRSNWKRRLVRFLGQPFSMILTASFFTRWESLFLPGSARFDQLVEKHRPILTITATPGFDPWEAEIILFSKKNSISTVAIDFSWDNLTTNSKHIRKVDYLIAWNGIMKKEAIDIHDYSPDRVFVSGALKFDPYFDSNSTEPTRDEFLKSKGLNPIHKTILYTTVTKAYPFQKKYIHDLIEFRKSGAVPYTNLFIRLHPLDLPDNYAEFIGLPDFHIETSGQEIVPGRVEMDYNDLLNLKYSLKYTDLNINYASTISIEACIFDKPIINIGYLGVYALAYGFNHYRPIYESGAVRLAKTDDDFQNLMNMYLGKPWLDWDNRKKIAVEYVGFTDGISYKRSVDILERIVSAQSQ